MAFTEYLFTPHLSLHLRPAAHLYVKPFSTIPMVLYGRSRTFARSYRDACLDAAMAGDRMQLRYTPREYHYTLYYYDQAGNLSMTVPPDGVAIQSEEEAAAVEDYREILATTEPDRPLPPPAHPHSLLPDHTLLTHYRYNNFNEVVLSDAPDRDPSRTWYDFLGRATMSRDGRQSEANRVSYTLYDNLGRPYEVGEIDATQSAVNGTLSALARDRRGLLPALVDRRDRYSVTRTFYSSAAPLAYAVPELNPLSLRNRVAAVTFQAVPPPLGPDEEADRYYYAHYDFASHYRYDIGGNVEVLVQDFAALPDPHRYKVLEYDYDLISGNVHSLYYQRGRADQFTYHYRYDKLNRLSEVFSSEIETDHSRSNLWKRDAEYVYYDHGPLRRTILGQDRLQGLDYAYTLQGWIKGVNGSLGDDYRDVAVPDISMDGYGGGGAQVPVEDAIDHRDLYRYANQYFNDDYRSIGGNSILSPMDATLPPDYELFNGNIVRHYQSTIADGFRTAGLVGEYDQLNRLRFGTNAFYGTANQAELSLTEALEAPTYDGNGNIRTLDRSYTSSTEQRHRNRLAYTYAPGTNRLTRVDADVHGAAINEDWLPFDLLRGRTEYAYDGSGNLTTETNDGQAGETRIDWNPYGKVTTVTSPTGTTTFGYGPDQHRWVKDRGERGVTYYVRDAQGSTLATYEGGRAGAELRWKQQYLFGSSRLGEVVFDRPIEPTTTNPFNYGQRRYELPNHLGNVTTVFGENAVAYEDTEDGTTYTAPALVSYRDYLAFGLGMDRGADILGTDSYRFGFNSKELDSDGEWGVNNTVYNYGVRLYSPIIGRFVGIDPVAGQFSHLSPYNYAANEPIAHIDLYGLQSHLIIFRTYSTAEGALTIRQDIEKPASGIWNAMWATYAPKESLGNGTLIVHHQVEPIEINNGNYYAKSKIPYKSWVMPPSIISRYEPTTGEKLESTVSDLANSVAKYFDSGNDPAAYYPNDVGHQSGGIVPLSDHNNGSGKGNFPTADNIYHYMDMRDWITPLGTGGVLDDATKSVPLIFRLNSARQSMQAADQALQRIQDTKVELDPSLVNNDTVYNCEICRLPYRKNPDGTFQAIDTDTVPSDSPESTIPTHEPK